MAAKPSPRKPAVPDDVVCEPGRHVGCLHAMMAAKRATPRTSRIK